jgi:hypothetical protein
MFENGKEPMNKQLRELIRHKKTEPRYTLGKKQVDYILSTIDEALPKEETGFSFLMFKMGYNACLSDIHQLLK